MRPRRGGSPRRLLGERVHAETPPDRRGAWQAVYALVRRIPRGRIMTYGQIAVLVEHRLSARAVGWALHGCPRGVPWQRVVNAAGGCSTDRLPDIPQGLQQSLLEREGVRFREGGTLDVEGYRWHPPGADPVSRPGPIKRRSRARPRPART